MVTSVSVTTFATDLGVHVTRSELRKDQCLLNCGDGSPRLVPQLGHGPILIQAASKDLGFSTPRHRNEPETSTILSTGEPTPA